MVNVDCLIGSFIIDGKLDLNKLLLFVFTLKSEVPPEKSLCVGLLKVGVEKLVYFYKTNEFGLYCILYYYGSTIGLVFGYSCYFL